MIDCFTLMTFADESEPIGGINYPEDIKHKS